MTKFPGDSKFLRTIKTAGSKELQRLSQHQEIK